MENYSLSDLAKDGPGPEAKLAAYYHGIVEA